jgi:hypothetical protein
MFMVDDVQFKLKCFDIKVTLKYFCKKFLTKYILKNDSGSNYQNLKIQRTYRIYSNNYANIRFSYIVFKTYTLINVKYFIPEKQNSLLK